MTTMTKPKNPYELPLQYFRELPGLPDWCYDARFPDTEVVLSSEDAACSCVLIRCSQCQQPSLHGGLEHPAVLLALLQSDTAKLVDLPLWVPRRFPPVYRFHVGQCSGCRRIYWSLT